MPASRRMSAIWRCDSSCSSSYGMPASSQVQIQLAAVGALEEAPELLVAGSGATICLSETRHLVGSLVHPQRVERLQQLGRVDVRDLQGCGGAGVVSDEGRTARRKRRWAL